jgi:hypothetical protein
VVRFLIEAKNEGKCSGWANLAPRYVASPLKFEVFKADAFDSPATCTVGSKIFFRFFPKLLEGEGNKTTSHRTCGNRDRTGEFQVKPSIGRSSFCHDGPQQKVHTFACSECHGTPLEVEIPRRKKSTTQHFYLFIYGIWVRFLIFKSGKPGAHLRVHLCVLSSIFINISPVLQINNNIILLSQHIN